MQGEIETAGFSSEWITVGDHRILVSTRVGPPDPLPRRAAMIAAWSMEWSAMWDTQGLQEDFYDVRLARVFYENKHSTTLHLTFGALSTAEHADAIAGATARVVESVFENLPVDFNVVRIKPGFTSSDGYDHTSHLTLNAIKEGFWS